jgi:hypothetical protein
VSTVHLSTVALLSLSADICALCDSCGVNAMSASTGLWLVPWWQGLPGMRVEPR